MADGSHTRKEFRIEASTAARLIEEMLEALGDCPPARLYRLLSSEVGLHQVTLMRYHQGKLATVSAERMRDIRRVHAEVLGGELTTPARSRTKRRCQSARRRVPAAVLRPLFDRLMKILQITEREVLYRCLAERTGMNGTTLYRYHRGGLASAPASLEWILRGLIAGCAMDRYPELTRASGGKAVTPRSVFKSKVDDLARTGAYRRKSKLFSDLAAELGVQPERLRKAYYDSRLRLVPRLYCKGLDRLLEKLDYDPSRTYRIGERIRHPHFGVGVVRSRRPRRAILVELHDGSTILLREDYQHDRYWERVPDAEQRQELIQAASIS